MNQPTQGLFRKGHLSLSHNSIKHNLPQMWQEPKIKLLPDSPNTYPSLPDQIHASLNQKLKKKYMAKNCTLLLPPLKPELKYLLTYLTYSIHYPLLLIKSHSGLNSNTLIKIILLHSFYQ